MLIAQKIYTINTLLSFKSKNSHKILQNEMQFYEQIHSNEWIVFINGSHN
jgi:hypothetical protein